MLKKPWIIRHRYVMLGGGILLFILSIFLMFSILFFWALFPPLFLIIFFLPWLLGSFMITSYSIAKRYNEVLNALEHDVAEARMGFFGRVLACQTLRFGKFSLRYKPRAKYSPAFYELTVPTSKALPPKEMISFKPSPGFVWELDELDSLDVSQEIEERMKKSLETGAWSLKEDSQLFEKLPMERLKQLRSLIYIKTEKGAHENAWVARFDDKWLYSETPDIIECMKILREVEWKL